MLKPIYSRAHFPLYVTLEAGFDLLSHPLAHPPFAALSIRDEGEAGTRGSSILVRMGGRRRLEDPYVRRHLFIPRVRLGKQVEGGGLELVLGLCNGHYQ